MGPLLKWAGGKRQLLPQLRPFYPARFRRYIEPFFGSGAVFFDLCAAGRLAGHEVLLIDSNPDLIGCYEQVRDHPEPVARALDRLAAGHEAGGRAFFLRVRDGSFNPERQARRRPDGTIAYTPELAAMFIYLNRTGFNGLFRVNASGGFNVPPGRYTRPRIADRHRIALVSSALSLPMLRLVLGSYDTIATSAAADDFLYIDPPYAPLTRTAHFTAYTAPGFDTADQERLQRLVVLLARRGCHVLMSNSTAGEIQHLYDGNAAARAAGLRAFRVAARRAINSVSTRRGPVDEYVITNVHPRVVP